MNEMLAERVVWRRLAAHHHYVGTLSACDDGIVLAGREPGSGIEVVLSIPFGEVDRIHLSSGEPEALVGEQAVVLELADSEPIVLREIGLAQLRAAALAAKLTQLAARRRAHLGAPVTTLT